jgi:hypothetical protein
MNNINLPINENLLPNLNSPTVFYIFGPVIVFLIIMLLMMIYDISPSFIKPVKSKQQIITQTFTILFFSLLIVGACIIFIPSLKEIKSLFQQISSVTYVILYTIFAILFYAMVSKDILKKYSYIINPVILGLGAFSFYKGYTDNYIEKLNINYERIKSLILLFCLMTIIITFYKINPSFGKASKYFEYSLFFTIILSVFAFLYIIILLTIPGDQGTAQNNSLNFSSFGTYGAVFFVVFLISIAVLLSRNKGSIFNNKEKISSIMIMLLVICILSSTLLSISLFSDFTDAATDNNKVGIFKDSLSVLFGIVISGVLIYWFCYNIESFFGKSGIVSFLTNLMIVILLLGIIYKSVNIKSSSEDKNINLSTIINYLMYIPYIVSILFDWLGKNIVGEYNAATAGSFMMLVLAIVLIVVYFKAPAVANRINTQGGMQLVNKPVFTDTEYNLGNYKELNGSKKLNYQYAISCWIFIHSFGANTNSNYNKFTSLLNFGNKPNILYNGKTNTLMITMDQKNLKDVTKNKLIDFDDNDNRIIYVNKKLLLQKWNNIIINYSGGTLDIFLNGELVKSSIEVAPYYTFDNLTIGENDGIKGGICNVVYFRHALNGRNIYFLYNTVKDKDTPTFNDSNDTIMVKNKNKNQINTSIEPITNE